MLIKRPWSEAANNQKCCSKVQLHPWGGLQSLGLGCVLISLAPFGESNSLSL